MLYYAILSYRHLHDWVHVAATKEEQVALHDIVAQRLIRCEDEFLLRFVALVFAALVLQACEPRARHLNSRRKGAKGRREGGGRRRSRRKRGEEAEKEEEAEEEEEEEEEEEVVEEEVVEEEEEEEEGKKRYTHLNTWT